MKNKSMNQTVSLESEGWLCKFVSTQSALRI